MRRAMSHLGEGADTVGLIHADMHLGNALFWRGEVKVIDFDDCGFGYWLYDIAVSLWELRHRNDYEHFRSALIDGYTRRRPLPPGCLRWAHGAGPPRPGEQSPLWRRGRRLRRWPA